MIVSTGARSSVKMTSPGLMGTWLVTAVSNQTLSLVPLLTGRPQEQQKHEFLYWEFHEGGFKQAALYQGRWKGIRRLGEPLQLFDTDADVAEQNDVAAAHSDPAARAPEVAAA